MPAHFDRVPAHAVAERAHAFWLIVALIALLLLAFLAPRTIVGKQHASPTPNAHATSGVPPKS